MTTTTGNEDDDIVVGANGDGRDAFVVGNDRTGTADGDGGGCCDCDKPGESGAVNRRSICDLVYSKQEINDRLVIYSRKTKVASDQDLVMLRLFVILYFTYLKRCVCLLLLYSWRFLSRKTKPTSSVFALPSFCVLLLLSTRVGQSAAYASELDKTERFLDKINLEQSIAAVFNKVAYGSTTKRSIPDNAYPVTTLATPLLTTYRYSDGSNEWLRVDEKTSGSSGRSNVDFELPDNDRNESGYGVDLEKDHALPTSAPAADILKNNNNRHYGNPNRYNNDRLRPDYRPTHQERVTENAVQKATTTIYNPYNNGNSKNVRPTKSMYTKDVPSYVPPSRVLFTPPLPPEFLNPFADKPTLRGTNSDGFMNRRPIPPPSLTPNKDKDRIPFRPDLPPSRAVNAEKAPAEKSQGNNNDKNATTESGLDGKNNDRKKMLNTPHNVRYGDLYGGNKNFTENNFEYEKSYVPTITRILSGSNGRQDEIPDVLLRTVTATPNVQKSVVESKTGKPRASVSESSPKIQEETKVARPEEKTYETGVTSESGDDSHAKTRKEVMQTSRPVERPKPAKDTDREQQDVATTQISDIVNLPNVKEKDNVTKASSDEIWLICWNVHVYLVVFGFILLAVYSIYKLICYENDPHMFSKSYFLTIHLMLTVICVLRIFYLTYDPYNFNKSFNIFLYDFLHNFPLSLLATTFAVLILFLLKRTLTHLEVKTRPVFLVVFGLSHVFLCFVLSILESFGHFDHAGLIVCKPVFILLAWALGCSYLYLYRIIKNVLAKKSQNLSEMCTQNISYASHITIAVALLFILLGCMQLYALFFIKVDRFNGEIKHHWILWGFELSVRFLEISIITLLAIVVSLKMSQREKQTVGFPLFPCTTSDSSTDNIYPNNCNTNPNAMNYTRNEMILDGVPSEPVERPNLLKNNNASSFQNECFDDKKGAATMLERGAGNHFDRFDRPKWGSGQFEVRQNSNAVEQQRQASANSFERAQQLFERGQLGGLNGGERNSRKTYEAAKYYAKPKYDADDRDDDYHRHHDLFADERNNVYSEPVDGGSSDGNHYERTRHEFERSDAERRSRNSSSNTSGRRSTGRARRNQHHARPHAGAHTLPAHQPTTDSMVLVDEQGFVRFRHLQDEQQERPKKAKRQHGTEGTMNNVVNAHFGGVDQA